MAHKTVGISLPEELIAKLPELSKKYNVATNSMLIRKVLEEAVVYHLLDEQVNTSPWVTELPMGTPKGDTSIVTQGEPVITQGEPDHSAFFAGGKYRK